MYRIGYRTDRYPFVKGTGGIIRVSENGKCGALAFCGPASSVAFGVNARLGRKHAGG